MLGDRAYRITKEIQTLDRDLYCEKDSRGVMHIMRKALRWQDVDMGEESSMKAVVSHPQHIFSLTRNWQLSGEPCDWGLEPIVRRIREIDSQNAEAIIHKMEEMAEEADRSKKRDFKNKTEDFLREFRPQFARAFNDVNTANMDKTSDKRRLKDGNRKS